MKSLNCAIDKDKSHENLKYVLSRNLLHYIQGESHENLKLYYIRG